MLGQHLKGVSLPHFFAPPGALLQPDPPHCPHSAKQHASPGSWVPAFHAFIHHTSGTAGGAGGGVGGGEGGGGEGGGEGDSKGTWLGLGLGLG